MAQAKITFKGTIVTRQTLCKLRKSEIFCEYDKRKRNLFYYNIEKKLGRSMSYPDKPIPDMYISYKDNSEEAPPLLTDDADTVESDGTTAYKKSITNNLLHSEANIPQGIYGNYWVINHFSPW